MKDEALKLGLKALKACNRSDLKEVNEAIEAAEKVLAQPAQEPVAVVAVNQSGGIRMEYQDGSEFDISKHVAQKYMNKYTKSPWVIEEQESYAEYWVTEIHYEVGPARIIYSIEDARLISAAPDLLEALQLVDAMLSGANMNANVVKKKIKAAIAKAFGEQA